MNLKPCPFCGYEEVKENSWCSWWIYCSSCKARGPKGSYKTAIWKWNNRRERNEAKGTQEDSQSPHRIKVKG